MMFIVYKGTLKFLKQKCDMVVIMRAIYFMFLSFNG